jgi:hypothetical protein
MPSPSTAEGQPKMSWITVLRARLIAHLQQREEQVFLLLSLLIGALTGLAIVDLIVVAQRLGMRLYLTAGFYPNGQPSEIFIRMAKAGSTIARLMECFSTAFRLAFSTAYR